MVQVLRNQAAGLGTEATFASRTTATFRHSLLLVVPPGYLSDSLIAAVEREFAWLSIISAQELRHACAELNGGTELVLIEQQFLEDFLEHGHDLRRKCPSVSIAILTGPRTPDSELLTQAIETHAICGVLPMDVNLDVWLSILKILIKGGEYFPPRLFQHQKTVEAIRPRVSLADPGVQRKTGSSEMHHLTERERQILERVARGNQNKIIAADLGLSEHTVKIHLHNIIRKLGVHNRTEAAAIYHAQTKRRAADGEDRHDDGPADEAAPSLRSEGEGGRRA